jgi:cytochrome oxidase Cu insertion factor (SCO1/SenC/PrrC family)
MRKLTILVSLASLLFLVAGNQVLLSQQEYTQEQMDAWQAIAESYYVEGVDENFLTDNPLAEGRPNMWGFRDATAIQSGMNAPDFTLLDMDGQPVALTDFVGEKFIVLITGSWY